MDEREYVRLLRGDPVPHEPANPLILINADAPRVGKNAMVRALIGLRHGGKSPWSSTPNTEREIAQLVKIAAVRGLKYLWLDNIGSRRSRFVSRAISLATRSNHYQGHPLNLSIYLTGNDIQLGTDLQQVVREIRLTNLH